LTGTNLTIAGGNTQDLASIIDWNNLLNIPADIADGDDDTTYIAGTGLSLTGTTFSSTLGTEIDSSEIVDGTITGIDIANDTIDATQLANNINVSEFTNDAGYLTSANLNDDDATNELNTNFQINGGNLEIVDNGGTLSVALADINTVDSVNGQTGNVTLNSDNISEGTTNLYFTNARADARIAAASINNLADVNTTGATNNQVLS
jgi:hypothetical protein